MSLLDSEDADTPLNPTPFPGEQRVDGGHVSSNPAAAFMEDPSTIVLANSFSGGETSSTGPGFATLPKATHMSGGGGASAPDITGEGTGTTPVKHSKLTKFMAHRKKLSKGSIKVKKGTSPPPSPKALKPASGSPEQAKKKHRYSTLRDETDSASDCSLSPEPPDNLDPSTGATMVPTYAEVSTTPVRGSTSSAGDIGSELLSPMGSSTTIGSPVASTTGVQGGLVRPTRQSQPSVAISSAVASGHSQGPAPVLPMVSPWTSSSSQAGSKADNILVPSLSSQPVPQVAANSPWTSQTTVAAGKESSAGAATTGQPGSDSDWIISDEMRQKLVTQFWDLSPENGLLKGV